MEREQEWLQTNSDNLKHMFLHLNLQDHIPDPLNGERYLNDEYLQPELIQICNNRCFFSVKHTSDDELTTWLLRFFGNQIPLGLYLKFPKHLQWRLTQEKE